MPHSPPPALVLLFLGVYGLVAGSLFLYGMHAYVMVLLYRRVGGRRSGHERLPDQPPRVTVQLPIYNELYVAGRLVQAACRLDYPRDRLEIQVLDDSDDETAEHVAALCATLRGQGFAIEHRQRRQRVGYKGGALRDGLDTAGGELIAVFDADFIPPRDFLRKTVPYFEDPAIGMVQSRWGHLNEDYSPLTRAQAMALDGHFLVEQTVRNRTGAFINFNGTAGIWRRQCIVEAGNWQDDTLTEDLDLSYRAQLRGWRFLYVPELCCPAELPADVNAFKGQQYRWAKGSMETARKLLPTVLRAPLPAFTKLQACIHLTNHLVYPLLLALAILTLPGLLLLNERPETRPFFTVSTLLVVASFGHPLLYAVARRILGRPWRETLLLIPYVVAGGMGVAVNNTLGVVRAWRGQRSAFIRTPKYRLVQRGDAWLDKRYRQRRTTAANVEIALGLYVGASVVYAVAHGHYAIVPFLLLYCAGLMVVGCLSITHARRPARAGSRTEPVPEPEPVLHRPDYELVEL